MQTSYGALWGDMRLSFALVSVSVGVCDSMALGGVCRGEIGHFLACCLACFGRGEGAREWDGAQVMRLRVLFRCSVVPYVVKYVFRC